MRRHIRTRIGNDEGAAAVEFALVCTVLVLLLFGITQFGLIFYQWLEIEHAAREGARWASLENVDGSVSTPGTTRYKVAEAAPGLTPPIADEEISIDPPNPDAGLVGEPVKVVVTHEVPLMPLMQGILGLSGPTFHLQASAVQRIE